jgi:hypothetical protein
MRAVPEFSFTATEHDLDRPWIVVGTSRGKVMLPEGENFFAWAHENWPAPRRSV